ncbi:MAG TPA: hypothetical protein PLK27_06295 [Neisseria sp.]|nr:hypothetical protein [Neisseria sp.]
MFHSVLLLGGRLKYMDWLSDGLFSGWVQGVRTLSDAGLAPHILLLLLCPCGQMSDSSIRPTA